MARSQLSETIHTPAIRIFLMGRMRILTADDTDLAQGLGRRCRAVLAIIAMASPTAVKRSALGNLLWSRRGETQQRASLRQEIHRLQESTARGQHTLVKADREHLSLQPGAAWIDAKQMLAATTDNPDALSTAPGELLEDFDGLDPALDGWIADERDRLREHALAVLAHLFDRRSPSEDAIPSAQRLLRFDSTHEGAWRALMRAYADQGERGAAIDAYARCRSALQTYLGALPSEETERLVVRIRSGEDALASQTRGLRHRHIQAADFRAFRPATVAVLPLGVRGGDADPPSLGEQLGEEISSALVKFLSRRLASVVFASRKPENGGLPQNSAGPDYTVEGSVHATNGSRRVNLRLVRHKQDECIAWAGQFFMGAIHANGWAEQAAARLDQELAWEESKRATRLALEECSAEDLVYRARPFMLRLGSIDFAAAEPLLRRALVLDPSFAPAHLNLAYNLNFQIAQGTVEDIGRIVSDARYHAARAISLAPDSAKALAVAGHVRAFLDHKPMEGLELHERAIKLNPGLAMAWGFSAAACMFLGRISEARSRLARYRQVEIEDHNGILFESWVILLELGARDIGAAVEAGRRTVALGPRFATGLRYHLAALGHAGLVDEAHYVRARLLDVQPGLTIAIAMAQSAFRGDADRDYVAEGLRLGGLAEGGPTFRETPGPTQSRTGSEAGLPGS